MATPVTQTTTPWQPIADQLGFGYQQARQLYDQGGPTYFPGQTYVDFAPQTQAALNAMQARATAGSPLTDAAQATARSLLGADALSANPADAYLRPFAAGTAPAGPAARYATGFAGGVTNPALSAATELARRPVSNPALRYAEAGARGDYLDGNPHLDRIYDQAARRVRDQVNATFGTSGRSSSGAHADLLSRNLGDLAADVYGHAYESERDRQLRSQDLLARLGQQRFDNRLSATSLEGQLAQNDRAQQLDAIGLLQNDFAQAQANQLAAAGQLARNHGDAASRQLAAAQLAPDLAAADYADLSQLLAVGKTYEARDLAEIQDQVQRHNFAQSEDAQRLAQFMALLGGGAGFRTTQTTAPEPDSIGTALGYGQAAANIAGTLGSLASLFT
ncbi:MAG: hypothetical protein RIM84_26075 [Alphaproteobacteria bacterium]